MTTPIAHHFFTWNKYFAEYLKTGQFPEVNPHDLDRSGQSAWSWLIGRHSKSAVHHLFEQGYHPDHFPEEGTHPLFFAVQWPAPDMVQEMLDHGADPNKISSEGITPFQKAMAVLDPEEEGYVLDVKALEWRVLKLFLEYPGIDLNIQYDQKKTMAQFLQHFLSAPTLEMDDDIFEYLKAKQERHALKNQTAPALSQRSKARF